MSIESLSIAINHSRAQGTARLVLIGIANHDGDGGAWPSVATLKRYAGGIDKRNVQRAIEKLEELGEIRRKIQAGGTPEMIDALRPNFYEFLLQCPPHCDRSSNHRDIRKPLITFEDDPVASAPPGGVSAVRGVASAPPKPSLNPTTQLKKETHLIARETKHIYAETGWCITCQADPHRLEVFA